MVLCKCSVLQLFMICRYGLTEGPISPNVVCRYRALMNFLSNVLREDGGFEYKKAIVDSILILIKDIPDAKEPGLGHLCEFIEARSSLPILCYCLVEDSTRHGAVKSGGGELASYQWSQST